MNPIEIVASDMSGFCDIETGECVVVDAGTPRSTETDDSAHGGSAQNRSEADATAAGSLTQPCSRRHGDSP